MSQTKQKRLIFRASILAVLILAVGYTLYANATKESQGALAAGDKA